MWPGPPAWHDRGYYQLEVDRRSAWPIGISTLFPFSRVASPTNAQLLRIVVQGIRLIGGG